MIRGMKRNGLRYEGGTILDPRDGSVYKAVMTLDPAKGILILRGYLGFEILGKNDIWHHVPDSNCAQLDKALLTKLKPACAEAAKAAPKAKPKAPRRRRNSARCLLRRRQCAAAEPHAGAQEFARIDGVAVHARLVVQMRSGRAAGRSDLADDVAGAHPLADLHVMSERCP